MSAEADKKLQRQLASDDFTQRHSQPLSTSATQSLKWGTAGYSESRSAAAINGALGRSIYRIYGQG